MTPALILYLPFRDAGSRPIPPSSSASRTGTATPVPHGLPGWRLSGLPHPSVPQLPVMDLGHVICASGGRARACARTCVLTCVRGENKHPRLKPHFVRATRVRAGGHRRGYWATTLVGPCIFLSECGLPSHATVRAPTQERGRRPRCTRASRGGGHSACRTRLCSDYNRPVAKIQGQHLNVRWPDCRHREEVFGRNSLGSCNNQCL